MIDNDTRDSIEIVFDSFNDNYNALMALLDTWDGDPIFESQIKEFNERWQ